MKSLYVAGPVLQDGDSIRLPQSRKPPPDIARQVLQVYSAVRTAGAKEGVEVALPMADPLIEHMTNGTIAGDLLRNLRCADGVLSVLLDADMPTAMECAIASSLAKPRVVLAQTPTMVPRLVLGMPGTLITAPLTFEDIPCAVGHLVQQTSSSSNS